MLKLSGWPRLTWGRILFGWKAAERRGRDDPDRCPRGAFTTTARRGVRRSIAHFWASRSGYATGGHLPHPPRRRTPVT